ncbi:MAG: hypothetical protein QXY62_04345 [Candidatus Altiarchaeota archaeon]
MAHLKFRRGYNENGSNFDVEFHFDYDENFKKRLRAITLYTDRQKLTIPWVIFEYYAKSKPSTPFISQSGLRMWFKDKELFISNYGAFNLNIHEEQLNVILSHAYRIENKFSTAVEDVLKEFIAESV